MNSLANFLMLLAYRLKSLTKNVYLVPLKRRKSTFFYFINLKNMSGKLHGGFFHSTLRKIQENETSLQPHNFMYPIFVMWARRKLSNLPVYWTTYFYSENDDEIQEIASMPGVPRLGVNQVKKHLEPLVSKGLESIILFGVTDKLSKVNINYNYHLSSLSTNFINTLGLKWIKCWLFWKPCNSCASKTQGMVPKPLNCLWRLFVSLHGSRTLWNFRKWNYFKYFEYKTFGGNRFELR